MAKLSNSERKELRKELEELRETEARIRTTQDVNAFLKKEAELEKEIKTSRRKLLTYVGASAIAAGVIGYAAGYQLGPRPTETITKEVVREVTKEVPVVKEVIKEVTKEVPVIKEVTKEVLVAGPSPSTALFSPWAYPRADYPLATVGVGLFDDWTVYDQYERAFRDVIANCGGWSEFKNRIEGQRVVIKPVAMDINPKIPPKGDWGEALSPLTLRAVAKVVLEAKPAKVTFWSNSSSFAPFPLTVKALGFEDATKDLPVEWYNGTGTSTNPTPVTKLTPPHPVCSQIYYWPEMPAEEADTIISIANAKTHFYARCTLSLKNLEVSGAPRQVYDSVHITKGTDYYDALKDFEAKWPADPEGAFVDFSKKASCAVGVLHFKSYIDWLNKFKGVEPYDLPMRFLHFQAECTDNASAAFYGTKVKNWMAVNEFTKGVAGNGPVQSGCPSGVSKAYNWQHSWVCDYKALTPIKKYFLIGGYDIVAVDTVSAMAIGFSPFEIENPHSEIRYLQWSSLHGMGTHRLSEIEVKGVDDIFKINANLERASYPDAATNRVAPTLPPDKRVTEFLDCRSPYLTRFEAEVGEEIATRVISKQMVPVPYAYPYPY